MKQYTLSDNAFNKYISHRSSANITLRKSSRGRRRHHGHARHTHARRCRESWRGRGDHTGSSIHGHSLRWLHTHGHRTGRHLHLHRLGDHGLLGCKPGGWRRRLGECAGELTLIWALESGHRRSGTERHGCWGEAAQQLAAHCSSWLALQASALQVCRDARLCRPS